MLAANTICGTAEVGDGTGVRVGGSRAVEVTDGTVRARANQIFDLWDGNPNCDENTWRRNTFQTANQPCTTR